MHQKLQMEDYKYNMQANPKTLLRQLGITEKNSKILTGYFKNIY